MGNQKINKVYMVELGYNDLGLSDISFITLYTPWYQIIPHKARVFFPRLLRHTQEHVPRI
jgi:hypothetical protein